jgi:hypothetical protein
LRLDYCLKDPFPHEIWAGDPLNVNTPLHEPATETRISGGTELREWARLNGFAVPPPAGGPRRGPALLLLRPGQSAGPDAGEYHAGHQPDAPPGGRVRVHLRGLELRNGRVAKPGVRHLLFTICHLRFIICDWRWAGGAPGAASGSARLKPRVPVNSVFLLFVPDGKVSISEERVCSVQSRREGTIATGFALAWRRGGGRNGPAAGGGLTTMRPGASCGTSRPDTRGDREPRVNHRRCVGAGGGKEGAR